jgi:hypothetical protein
MADKSTTSFPKMGDNIAKNIMNPSGARSPYTTTTPKKTMGRGSSPTGRTGGTKKNVMIHEANGPACRVQHTLYKANAADAGKQLTNVKMIPSKMHRPDGTGGGNFWAKRQFGQNQ